MSSESSTAYPIYVPARHSIGALRFIISGKGGYTTVEGERFPMEAGDLILTPNGAWHDHANEGSEPMIWLDAHDLPIVRTLNALFFENYNAPRQEITRPVSASVGSRRAQAQEPAAQPHRRTIRL